MRKMIGAMITLHLASCGDGSWGYGARLDPRWRGPADDAWALAVTHAASEWDVALAPCMDSGLALSVIVGGHPVLRVDRGTLPHDAAGLFDGDSIRIERDLEEWEQGVLMHEMGHALGLGHVPESVDPDSVMNPSTDMDQRISEGDMHRARQLFGCDD